MSEVTLQCQGLPCPQPVLQCKRTVEESAPETIVVHVDNDPAWENTSRYLTSAGYTVTSAPDGNEFVVTAQKKQGANKPAQSPAAPVQNASSTGEYPVCVFITADEMGTGDSELGQKLMLNFLATLPELGEKLWRIILVNGAVHLAVEGSPALEQLQKMESDGVSILVCGTCLEFFGILSQKRVGETTNMLDVVTSLELADKVIRI